MERIPSILIVDDDLDICLLLKEIFKCFEVSCNSAHSIQSAKSLIIEVNPTHIVLDNILPDGFGKDFIAYLTDSHPEIKVILLTGDSEVSEGSLGDFFRIVQKPFTRNEIKEALEIKT